MPAVGLLSLSSRSHAPAAQGGIGGATADGVADPFQPAGMHLQQGAARTDLRQCDAAMFPCRMQWWPSSITQISERFSNRPGSGRRHMPGKQGRRMKL